ncbi:MAG: sigma-70 family RNA polymerase sigma factor [Myxococcota bacterium]
MSSDRKEATTTKQPLPASVSTSVPRLKADLLNDYLEMLSRIPLFSAPEERQAAKTLRELELEAWRRTFPNWQALEWVAAHPRILQLTDRGPLERVAQAVSQQVPLTTPALARDVEKLAIQLRDLDDDRVLIEGVFEHLVKESRGEDGLPGSRRQVLGLQRPTRKSIQDIDRARRASLTARNAFVRANLRLVVSVARGFHHFRLPLIDLIQEGNLGLIKAVHRFDHRKGFRFSTYAHWWIRQSIERAIMNKGAQVRLPVHVFDTRRQLTKAQKELAQVLGRRPTDTEVAEKLGVPLEKVEEVTQAIPRDPISLDDTVGGDDDRRLMDLVKDENVEPPDEAVMRENETARLRELLQLLTPVEMDIIRRRFGLEGANDETLDEIGKKYNLSRERVRQIQVQGLEKMRRFCERRQIGVG